MTTINDRMSHAFGLDATGWTRHANPWSGYTRIPVAVCLWAAVNPRAYPPPADLDSWASRGVLGETFWNARPTTPVPRGTASRPGC